MSRPPLKVLRGGAAAPATTTPAEGVATGWRARLAPGTWTPEAVLLAVATALLLLVGLAMTFSASFVQSTATTGEPFGIFARQAFWAALGLPALVGAAVLDHRIWKRLAGPLLVVTLAGLALVLVPGLGREVNGARRWFEVGPVSVQPSEIIKLALPVWVAAVLAHRWTTIRRGAIHPVLMPALPVTLLAAALVAAGPDLESALLVAAIGGVGLFVAGLPLRLVVLTLAGAVGAGVVGILSADYRMARVRAWVDPLAFSDTVGYQTTQGFIALGSGGWFGVGLGEGRGKWLYVPNAHTDFIYAIIGEELGLVGALAVLGLFTLIAVAGVRAARRAPDAFGRLLASSLTAWIIVQAAINISSVVGLLPVTGVTLPLVSFGGSSLAVTMLGLGILMSVARAGIRKDEHGPRTLREVPT